MNIKSFTMAEVLITLGIIGIVAAMTLPSLINKADEYVRKQQFKKVYSTLTNTLDRSFADNGGYYYECYYGEKRGTIGHCIKHDAYGVCQEYEGGTFGYDKVAECASMFASWEKIMNVIKKCNNNAVANGCVTDEMNGTDTLLKSSNSDVSDDEIASKTQNCTGFREESIKKKNASWVLADGSVIGFYRGMGTKIFWVDINGHKRPNKWGYDIFSFILVGNGKYVKIEGTNADPSCTPVEEGGKSSKEMLDIIYRK